MRKNPNQQQFERLIATVRGCTLCSGLPLGPNPILQASVRSRILVVGQAPGRIAHAKGRPFADVSGDRLRSWLGVDKECFYNPECFALIPMGFCYPGTGKGGDLAPRNECAPAWRQALLDGMPGIQLTLLLGQFAIRWHLGDRCGRNLTDTVNNWQTFWPHQMPLPHPSPRNARWLKNNPQVEAEMLPLLQQRVRNILDLHRLPASPIKA
jgi:uracil-DNA glycosylase